MTTDTTTTEPAPAPAPPDRFAGLPAIFRDCVMDEPDTHWKSMLTPWRQGDSVYATDGRIFVRVALAAVAVAGEPLWEPTGPLPIGTEYIARFWADTLDRIPSDADPVPIPDCGSGMVVCDHCHGRERITCQACKGARECRDIDRVKLDPGYAISRYYGSILRRHGVDRAFLPAPSADGVGACRFVGRDAETGLAFEGFLMPLRPTDDGEGTER